MLAAGLDGIEHRMVLPPPVNKNLFRPGEAEGLGLEMLPATLEEAVAIAEESDFSQGAAGGAEPPLLCRGACPVRALRAAADPAEYERIHYFNAI